MISIDIGTSRMYVIEATGKGRKVKVINSKIIDLHSRPILEGEKIQSEAFKEYLQLAFEGLHSKGVIITFSSLPIVANEFVLPYCANSKKMKTMISAKIYQNLSEDAYVFDYRVLSTTLEDKKRVCNVITYLMPRGIVEDTYKTIIELNKRPIKFTNTQDSVFNLMANFFPNQVSILANITEDQITFHLNNQPNNIITRMTSLSPQRLNRTTDMLIEEENEKDFGREEQVLSILNDQILKLVQYQTIKYIGKGIEKIILSGEPCGKRVNQFFVEELGIATDSMQEIMSQLFPEQDANRSSFLYAISAMI